MSEYRIFETNRFGKDIRAIGGSGRRLVPEKLRQVPYPRLRRQPHFGPNIKKLRNFTPETWRYRVGQWRFFYKIHDSDKIVFMTAASHRGSAY